MIGARGSVPYPPGADSQPVRQFAASLRQFANGLQQSSGQLTSVAAGTQASAWGGAAARAFGGHVDERARTVRSVATSMGNAAPALETYAAAIDTTSATYTSAALAEHAARAGLPWTAGALAAAIAAEQAAVAGLFVAGSACASALMGVNAEVAAALFLGVDRESFAEIRDQVMDVWNRVAPLLGDTATDAGTSAGAGADLRSGTNELEAAIRAAESRAAMTRPNLNRSPVTQVRAPAPAAPPAVAAAPRPVVPPATSPGAAPAPRPAGNFWSDIVSQRYGSDIGLANDAVNTAGSLADLIESTRPNLTTRVSPIIDPVTGAPTAVDARGNPVRTQSALINPRTGRPFDLLPDGRVAPPTTSLILDPQTGRPFRLDGAGRPVAGPRVIAPDRVAAAPNYLRSSGNVSARLDQIASQVARMDVNVQQPTQVPRMTAGGVLRTGGNILRVAGRVSNGIGLVAGGYDMYEGVRANDGYRFSDGAITAGLAVAGFLTFATPVGWALLGAGAIWAVASYASGDVPVTRRLFGSSSQPAPARPAPAPSQPAAIAPRGPAVVVAPAA